MKHTIKTPSSAFPLVLASLLACASLPAAVPLSWTVETTRAQPAQFEAYQGETLDFEAALQSRGKPLVGGLGSLEGLEGLEGLAANLYWQTNGMGTAYWTAPASVRTNSNSQIILCATWSPTNEVGAKVYNCFIALQNLPNPPNLPNIPNLNYHAAFQLRLRPSPGATPNALPLPTPVIDFAKVRVLNPPWSGGGGGADTNAVRALVDLSFVGGTNAVNLAVTGTVVKATNDISSLQSSVSTLSSSVSGLQSSKIDGPTDTTLSQAGKAADAKTTGTALAGKVSLVDDFSHAQTGGIFVSGGIEESSRGIRSTGGGGFTAVGGDYELIDTSNGKSHFLSAKADADDLDQHVEDTNVHVNLTEKESWNAKADAADVRTLNDGYQRLYAFSAGATNANISVTNYPPTAAEAEGRTHFDPTDPDLDFSTVPSSMRLDETRDGVKRTVVDTRDFTVWWWVQKAPKLLAAAKGYAEEKCAALFSRLAAWADRTARGLENPAGESTLVIDVPNIWLMTDQTFEKHVSGSNSCWVIRSKNAAVSPNVATNGFLELTDAFGTPYLRFNKTEATFADPPASGITYDAAAGEWLISYTTKAKPKGGANLAIQGSADYPGKSILKEEGDELCPAVITWTGSQFNWVMHAKPKQIAGADPNKMFFAAAIEVEGQDYIEYLKPVSFSHIVMPNGRKIAPDVPSSATVGSTVEWKVVQ